MFMDSDGDMFEWDEAKCCRCFEMRGFDFSIVQDFDFASAVVIKDDRFAYGEPRFRAFGPIADRLFVVVFTPRGPRLRIISIRRANKREERKHGQKT